MNQFMLSRHRFNAIDRNQFGVVLSKADLWVLAGIAAVKFTLQTNSNIRRRVRVRTRSMQLFKYLPMLPCK